MFRADAEADETGGDPAERWKSRKQPGRKRWFERCRLVQYACDDPALHRHLQRLGDPGGQLPSPLDLAQMIDRSRPLEQRFEQNIACSDCVLNSQINADSADRRHRVGRITDAQKSRSDTSSTIGRRGPSTT